MLFCQCVRFVIMIVIIVLNSLLDYNDIKIGEVSCTIFMYFILFVLHHISMLYQDYLVEGLILVWVWVTCALIFSEAIEGMTTGWNIWSHRMTEFYLHLEELRGVVASTYFCYWARMIYYCPNSLVHIVAPLAWASFLLVTSNILVMTIWTLSDVLLEDQCNLIQSHISPYCHEKHSVIACRYIGDNQSIVIDVM